MGFYTSYKAVFDAVKTALQGKSSLKKVVLGEKFKIAEFPMAVINATATTITQATLGSRLENRVGFEVLLIVKGTEPEDWFADIISVMGDVVDAILADRTLNNTVKDVWPTRFEPGEILLPQKRYYGGVVAFEALLYYTPS